jgi:hypothetical protein
MKLPPYGVVQGEEVCMERGREGGKGSGRQYICLHNKYTVEDLRFNSSIFWNRN